MKDVKDWTDKEALTHAEVMLRVFELEMEMLIGGREVNSIWACNRGGDSAMYNLGQLIKNYQRMTRVVADRIRSKKHETPRTFDSLEGK